LHYTKEDIAGYFDAVYYINLAHRLDRQKEFLKNSGYLHHSNIIRYDAVYGKDLDAGSWPGTPGALGVRQSHINVLKAAKSAGYQRFMVFEDDVLIKKSFPGRLVELLNEANDDWDMLYFYVENHYLSPIRMSKTINRLQNTLGLVGGAYHARNIDVIINKLENDYRWVDTSMADLHQILKVYAPVSSIVSHSVGYSDNEGLVINYKLSLNAKIKSGIKKILKKLLSR
jgi:GR25 family glycosyltransferase involved in LPS biosynthesis